MGKIDAKDDEMSELKRQIALSMEQHAEKVQLCH